MASEGRRILLIEVLQSSEKGDILTYCVIQKVLARAQQQMTGSQTWIFFLNETNVDAESLFDVPNVLFSFIPDSAQFAACHVHCAKVFAVRAATTHVVMFRVRSKTRKHVRCSEG